MGNFEQRGGEVDSRECMRKSKNRKGQPSSTASQHAQFLVNSCHCFRKRIVDLVMVVFAFIVIFFRYAGVVASVG